MIEKLSVFFGGQYFKLIALAVMLAGCFGAGWTANGWRLGSTIAEIKTEAATGRADAATAALKDLETGVKRVKDAAEFAQVDVGAINLKLDAIRKEYKNAKPPVLPADCLPGPVRVQSLTAASAAVDEAIARPKPSGTVPP